MEAPVSSEESRFSPVAAELASSRIDTSVAHPARRYNYWLGGKDNFQVDRESGDAIAAAFPAVRIAALENRYFLRRAVSFLSEEAEIRQFLDIGTGIPTANNTHEVAQSIAPHSRIVYVDNDPIVLSHARALLTSSPEGATAYIDADLREPEKILNHPDLLRTLDLSQPVALMLIAITHFIVDSEDPYGIVTRLLDALPSGSYLAVTNVTTDLMPPEEKREADAAATSGRHGPIRFRSRDEFARFFDGLELAPPGIGPVAEWRAENEPQPRPSAADASVYGGVARKP
ncbi:SAM-dependent methyltransferase [Micromonospora sp. IBHARD004]|uniref:SAM-dependent methyltransferase n=1 Tax=Micromonospora sp. IBHARD004 TaxID=3457764 RepID=UPI00405996FF